MLEPPMLAAYDTATRYQMYHALGMALVAHSLRISGDRKLATAGWLFAAGIVLFSGSLYGMTDADRRGGVSSRMEPVRVADLEGGPPAGGLIRRT
jgi:uncharacterized membrane protein YgdD (TMEM256/DUF423 family)